MPGDDRLAPGFYCSAADEKTGKSNPASRSIEFVAFIEKVIANLKARRIGGYWTPFTDRQIDIFATIIRVATGGLQFYEIDRVCPFPMHFQSQILNYLHLLRPTRIRILDIADCQGVPSALHAEARDILGLSAMIVRAACDTGLFVFSGIV